MKKSKKNLAISTAIARSLGSMTSLSKAPANTKRKTKKQKKVSIDCAVIVARGGKGMLA